MGKRRAVGLHPLQEKGERGKWRCIIPGSLQNFTSKGCLCLTPNGGVATRTRKTSASTAPLASALSRAVPPRFLRRRAQSPLPLSHPLSPLSIGTHRLSGNVLADDASARDLASVQFICVTQVWSHLLELSSLLGCDLHDACIFNYTATTAFSITNRKSTFPRLRRTTDMLHVCSLTDRVRNVPLFLSGGISSESSIYCSDVGVLASAMKVPELLARQACLADP